MRDIVHTYVRKFREERRERRKFLGVLLLLALAVSGGIMWQFKTTGIALTNEVQCGLEEHSHTDECYAWVLTQDAADTQEAVATQVTVTEVAATESGAAATDLTVESGTEANSLTADASTAEGGSDVVATESGSDAGTDTEAEAVAADESQDSTAAGSEAEETQSSDTAAAEMTEALSTQVLLTEATESDDWYLSHGYEKILVCGQEEHTHTVSCLSDETADVETAEIWEATLPTLTGVWADDVAAIAESQIGYTESTLNFTLDEDGTTRKGYTRYGAWYGNAYGDWDAMFAAFCLHYAGISEDDFPVNSGAYAWSVSLKEAGLYQAAEGSTPAVGSLVFLDKDLDGAIDAVGIITDIYNEETVLTVVEGNSNDAVEENNYEINDATVAGYGVLPTQDEESLTGTMKTYIASTEDESVTVTVTAPYGALSEGAKLCVTLYEEDSDEYTAAAEAIEYNPETVEVVETEDGIALASEDDTDTETVTTSGLAVLDICFKVDGVEVEPTDTVTVSIDASAIIPEEADASTIEVQHLTENEDGKVEAVLVADATEETEGIVTADAENTTVVAEFTADSFSTFTIQWSANSYDSTAITTTCYFSSDGSTYSTNTALVPAGVNTSSILWVGYDNEVDFDDSNSLLVVDGYTLDHAVLYVPDQSGSGYTSYSITSLRVITNWKGGWTYQYLASESTTWTTFTVTRGSNDNGRTAYLYLYYNETEPELTGDLTITDDIASTGSLVAKYSGNEELTEGSYYYRWYKLDTTSGEYELIEGEIENSLAVYIDGARETYKVELVWTATDEVVATSNTYLVPYYDQLQNGSFEEPTVPSSNDSMQYTSGLYEELVWLTTGFGSNNTSKGTDGQDIEIVKASGNKSGSNGWNETVAADGNQYAELNAEADGTLYQDVMTIPGVPLYWQAAHEARGTSGVDMMCVIIVDAEFAEAHLTTQDQIDAVYAAAQNAGLKTNLADGEMSSVTFNYTVGEDTVSITFWLCASDSDDEKGSTNDAWNYFYGTYQVPDGQYLTRFLFGAISTCSGDSTVGNLLDDVSFSQTPPVSSKSGNITVTKTVEGLEADEVIAAETYTFTVKKSDGTEVGTVKLPTASATTDQAYYWTYTLTNITAGNYYVEETIGTTPSGYTYSSTTISPDGTTGTTSANFTVTNGNTSTVTFTNTYQKATTSITIKKVDSKDDNTTLNGAVFTLSGIEGTYKTENDGTVTINNIAYDTMYTLTETTAPDGYNLLTEPITFTVETDGTVSFTSGGSVASASKDDSGNIVITVQNTAGAVLPSTGGAGTYLYTLAGLLLILSAVCLMYKNLRRKGDLPY